MKLRNKKTGEIGYLHSGYNYKDYNSLAELLEEWEDYEEPEPVKPYWFINDLDGEPMKCDLKNCGKSNFIKWGEHRKEIGNYFSSREEAEKAVEKLKAWKRLKDKGFRFEGIKEDYTRILQSQDLFRTGKRYLQFNKSEDEDWMKENWKDIDLLFSGGEE